MSITEYLETQGIKHSHLGFTYLSDAIKIAHIEGIDFKLSYIHKAVADSRLWYRHLCRDQPLDSVQ